MVIVKRNKIKKAAAIRYDVGDIAPKVIARGKGIVADKILEKAEDEKLPVYKDEALANTLTQLDIGDLIPEALYQVVAEIMVFVNDLDALYDRSKYEQE